MMQSTAAIFGTVAILAASLAPAARHSAVVELLGATGPHRQADVADCGAPCDLPDTASLRKLGFSPVLAGLNKGPAGPAHLPPRRPRAGRMKLAESAADALLLAGATLQQQHVRLQI